MNIEIEIEHGADIASGVDIEGITQYVLEQEGCPATTEVSITLTTDEEVHRLNKEYRGIDRPTDVLSFECDGLDDDFDGGAAYDDAGVPDDEPFMLGDIIIASDYARAQTAQFGTTPQEELAVLLVHGFCTCADGIMCIPTKRPRPWRLASERCSPVWGCPTFARSCGGIPRADDVAGGSFVRSITAFRAPICISCVCLPKGQKALGEQAGLCYNSTSAS